MDDDELERQMKLPNYFSELTNEHFPLFLTVKALVYMMDASLKFPFFSRNYKGEIIGMESGA